MKKSRLSNRLIHAAFRSAVTPRRLTLLLATICDARGQVLDDLTRMLLKLVRRIEWKCEVHLDEWYANRRDQTDSLVRAFRDALIAHEGADDPVLKVARLDAVFTAHGGTELLEHACEAYLRHEKQNWRPFARQAFVPLRAALLRLADTLPLVA